MESSGLLWVDKYRPSSLSELNLHKELNIGLQKLCASGDVPHLFFYGPMGAGKRTRVHGVLRELFGPSADKVKVEHRTYRLGEPKKEVELTTVSSNHHIEVNVADAGNNDRLVVQEIIKEIASTVPLEIGKSPQNSTEKAAFKVVVLHDVEHMSRLAQQALRRTMEKYSRTCRIIMIAESATKVIEPLRSRCLGVRVPLPSESEVISVLRSISRAESFTVTDAFAAKLVKSSGRNLRRAVLQLEASKVDHYPFEADQEVVQADWEIVCADIARTMMAQQLPLVLLDVRAKLYELLTHAIPADIVFRSIVSEILNHLDQELAPRVIQCAALYEHRMQKGSKPIMHLEAFAAKFMQMYKTYLSSMLDFDF